jgi:hypothetical protein
MARSQKLRELIFHLIEQTTNELRVQTDATNFDFRKRIYEMKRAKEEAEYQMKSARETIGHKKNHVDFIDARLFSYRLATRSRSRRTRAATLRLPSRRRRVRSN